MSGIRRAISFAAVLALGLGTAPVSAAAQEAAEVPPDPTAETDLAASGLPAWDRVPTPNIGTGDNQLYGVDALTADDMWAVGYSSFDLRDEPLVEHFDGSVWSIAPSPEIGDGESGAQLLAVDAVAPDDVWAVGGYSNQYSLITHWDGSEWSLVEHPNPSPLQRLNGVAAAGPDDVWAVGYATTGGVSRTHVLHWDGSTWTKITSPNGSSGHNQLLGVDVIAPNDVWAVGEDGGKSLTLHWNGSTWSRVASPSNTLTAVSAVDHDDVWAVGTTAGNTLTEHWDGTAWSVVPSPKVGPFARLFGVQAIGTDDVWAVGYSSSGGTLALRWDGSDWSTVESPNRADPNFLRDVTAVATDDVVLVGEADFATLVERWDGADLEIEPSPDAGIGENELRGVHAGAPDDVWAVGTVEHGTYTQHWDGTEFSIVDSPSKRGRENVLEDVDGTAPDDVWAVGHHDNIDFIGSRTMAMHWDGSRWQTAKTPKRGGRHSQTRLVAVDTIAPDDAWAVGSRETTQFPKPVILRWNGTKWRQVPNGCAAELLGLTSFGTDDVWAVGGPSSCHWDGRDWTSIPFDVPDPRSILDLRDVDGVASDDLWAVGARFVECGEQLCGTGEIQHYDGSTWTHINTPAPTLESVHAVAADDVWAVGFGGVTIWHYNGAGWSEVPAPDLAGDGQAALSSIDGAGPDDLWAVGPQLVGAPVGASLAVHARSFDSGAVVGSTGVSDAVVSWFGPETGSVETDPLGKYQIGGLEVGKYTFIVTQEGCTPATQEVRVKIGTTINADIPLDCDLQ